MQISLSNDWTPSFLVQAELIALAVLFYLLTIGYMTSRPQD